MNVQVAIDGPAGAGKSSIAKVVSAKLGYLFVDSGAMYRAVAYLASQRSIPVEDAQGWISIARDNKIDLKNNSKQVFIGGQEVTDYIRTPEITANTRYAANNPLIREILVSRQREMGSEGSIVMEGRDIGSIVLPNANCKIYLDASPEIRAKRRYDEMKEKGEDVSLDEILKAVNERDESDKNRDVGPLVQAEDAVYIDSSDLNFEQVVEALIDTIKSKISE